MKIEYLLTKIENDFCNSVDSFNSLLRTNSRITIDGSKFKFGKISLNYQISTEKMLNEKERMFCITFTSNEQNDNIAVTQLEKVDKLLKRILRESGNRFYINTIWDEVSQYYCKKSYPTINEIENLMRKLIFRFMIKNIGSDWVQKSFPQRLRENLEKTAEKNEIDDLLENSLYEADFIQLIEFLFIPYSKTNDINKIFDALRLVDKIEDLEKIKDFQPRSNWERYFCSIVKIDNLDEKWNKLYKYRNKVAHNKLIIIEDYKQIIEISDEIKIALNKVIDDLDIVRVDDTDKGMVAKVAGDSLESKLTIFNNINNTLLNYSANIPKISMSSDIVEAIQNIQNSIKFSIPLETFEVFQNMQNSIRQLASPELLNSIGSLNKIKLDTPGKFDDLINDESNCQGSDSNV